MTRHRRYTILAVVAIAALLGLGACGDDDDGASTDTSTTTTTTAPSSTSTTEATTTTAAGGVTDEEAATIVWPDPAGDTTYDEPLAAAQGFAEELVGFGSDVVYSDFRQGDNRSGEIEIRPASNGPATTVLVRQMSDDHWYVLGAVSTEIDLTEPTASSAIDAPLHVAGTGRGFEGQLQVAVYERGSTTALGTGMVTAGSAGDMAAFEGDIEWSNPGGGWGSVVVTSTSGRDGGVWTAVAVPVGFIGGD